MNNLKKLAARFINKYAVDVQPYDDSFFLLKEDQEESSPLEEGTIYEELEEPAREFKHLPALMEGYLNALDYMDRKHLMDERKRLYRIIYTYKRDGIATPYPLKLRLEEVERRLNQ